LYEVLLVTAAAAAAAAYLGPLHQLDSENQQSVRLSTTPNGHCNVSQPCPTIAQQVPHWQMQHCTSCCMMAASCAAAAAAAAVAYLGPLHQLEARLTQHLNELTVQLLVGVPATHMTR
jgi:cobalamin biosynthesis protein CbiD